MALALILRRFEKCAIAAEQPARLAWETKSSKRTKLLGGIAGDSARRRPPAAQRGDCDIGCAGDACSGDGCVPDCADIWRMVSKLWSGCSPFSDAATDIAGDAIEPDSRKSRRAEKARASQKKRETERESRRQRAILKKRADGEKDGDAE